MSGYTILSLDELNRHSRGDGLPVLIPVRRRLGFQSAGVNCWTAQAVGDHVIEQHSEPGGTEELYVVLRGRATFTVGDETADAPVGTLIHVPSGVRREAVAAEPGTIVLAVGAEPGSVYRPGGWEDFYIAESLRLEGRIDEARATIQAVVASDPGAWQGAYNAACFEALAGDAEAAFTYLTRAFSLDADAVKGYATGDADLSSLRQDPRWSELLG